MRQKAILFAIVMMMAAISSQAFTPEQTHFKSATLYPVYQKWLENSAMYNDTPASLDAESIKMTYYTNDGRPVRVGFLIERGMLIECTEIWTQQAEKNPGDAVLQIMGGFLFRLNAGFPDTLERFSERNDVRVMVSGVTISAAELQKRLSGNRFFPQSITYNHANGETAISIDGTIDFQMVIGKKARWDTSVAQIPKIPGREPAPEPRKAVVIKPQRITEPIAEEPSVNVPESVSDVEPTEYEPEKETERWKPKASHEVATMVQQSELPDIRTTTLREMVKNYSGRILTRKVLQNQVKDPLEFIRGDFPDYRIDVENNQYRIHSQPYEDRLYSEIDVFSTQLSDGLQISSGTGFQIDGKNIVLPSGERIFTSNLSDEEVERIAPNLVALCNQHRALGRQLIHFLLTPDEASTTLVLKGETREMYEMHSYLQLLLLLNHWWQGRTVYFSITEVKKVNDYIELRGNLVARANDSAEDFDFADVRFHLNKYYRIDLAMMFLTPASAMKQ